MTSPAPLSPLHTLPSAFAEACRIARSELELFERCRAALVRHFKSERVWLTVGTGNGPPTRIGPTDEAPNAVEVAGFSAGAVHVAVSAEAEAANEMRAVAAPLAFALTVLVELRGVLLERQASLDDASFQLRALRQVSRLLASAHSVQHTEELVLDFMAEVFQASWAALYRPKFDDYFVLQQRATDRRTPHVPVAREALDTAVPAGIPTPGMSPALRGLVDADTQLAVPLDAGEDRVAVLVLGPRTDGHAFGRAESELAHTLAVAAAISLRNAELVAELHSAATTDALTGLMNRRALEERLRQELQRGERHHLVTSLVLIDVDHFKSVNDTLGHAGGDRLLRLIAQVLRREARALDVVGRLGGDEFVAILPMTTASEACIFAGRVQASLSEMQTVHPEIGLVSVSLGVAQAPLHGHAPGVLLASADLALYKAKHAGRNTVEVAGA